jgi:hypothetical protein
MFERLPDSNQKLVVINCSKSVDEVKEHRVYICPAEGSAYKHQESRYFGLYKKMTVSHIANIEAVVRVNTDNSTSFYWIAGSGSEEHYRQKALAFATELRFSKEDPPTPVKVFILGVLHKTDFKKDVRGGMQGNKQYFDVSEYNITTAGYLAPKLNGKTWPKN